jgi:hypothetical protein
MMLEWLTQDLTVPLYAFITALLLPAAFFARIAKEAVMARVDVLSE